MTPQDHNKVIGVLHLVSGALQGMSVLILFLVFGFVGMAALFAPQSGDAAIGAAVMGIIFLFVALICLAFTIPPLLAAYGLLKHKAWGRTAAIISSVISLIGFPLGTALGIYSLWFLLGDEGRQYYLSGGARQQGYMPPPPPATWRT